jgi:hypothetical protein
MKWLKKILKPEPAPPAAQPDPASQQVFAEASAQLTALFGEVKADKGTRLFVTEFVVRAQREILAGRPGRLARDATTDQLAVEAALQGFLDPQRCGALSGTVLHDDSLMRILVHYARQGNAAAANAVRHYAAGRLRKGSQAKGTAEAQRMAAEFAKGA